MVSDLYSDFKTRTLKEVFMPTGYHHLTYEERCRIYALKQRGDSQHQIAKHLRVSRSTISREIRRKSGLRGYRYKQAEAFATERRKRASRSPRKMHEALIEDLKEKLGRQWSPEQISGWFRRHRPKHAISHTTIYNFVCPVGSGRCSISAW